MLLRDLGIERVEPLRVDKHHIGAEVLTQALRRQHEVKHLLSLHGLKETVDSPITQHKLVEAAVIMLEEVVVFIVGQRAVRLVGPDIEEKLHVQEAIMDVGFAGESVVESELTRAFHLKHIEFKVVFLAIGPPPHKLRQHRVQVVLAEVVDRGHRQPLFNFEPFSVEEILE